MSFGECKFRWVDVSLEKSLDYDIVLDRDVSFSRSLYASRFLESYGIN